MLYPTLLDISESLNGTKVVILMSNITYKEIDEYEDIEEDE